ncbi:hypothetical protein OH491_13385 [Termitidicoccus mucosus]|uniref:SH3b domain-containing protein n=1 Tax=Termitidicoccus mucosus TaxID=1184151 RepID=A0A178IH99_9BACT|nr:hypothetical protein AW736_14055 [Opitutaceae bacterium TSB47]
MKTSAFILLIPLLLAAAPAARAAFAKGDTAYAKRLETLLLTGPGPFAGAGGKVAFGAPLKIEEMRGSWLRVSAKKPKTAGWVYAGNVAGEKPSIPPASGMTADTASGTAVAAAARPLTRIAGDYAEKRSLDPGGDEWLTAFAAAIVEEDIIIWLIENKKGEYQQ